MQFNSFEHVHLWQSFSKDLRHLVKRTMEWARRAQRFLRAPLAISSTPSTATPKRKAKAKAAPVAQVTAPLAGPACDHRRIKRSGNRHGSYTVHGAQEEMEVDSKAGVLRHSIGFLTIATAFLQRCCGRIMGDQPTPGTRGLSPRSFAFELPSNAGDSFGGRYTQEAAARKTQPGTSTASRLSGATAFEPGGVRPSRGGDRCLEPSHSRVTTTTMAAHYNMDSEAETAHEFEWDG